MMIPKISIAAVQRELDGRTMEEARELVRQGEARWIRGQLATLRLVPPGYSLGESELFIVEAAPDHFVPDDSV